MSLLSLDVGGASGRSPLAVVGPTGDVRSPRERSPPPAPTPHLPHGWEQRTTNNGRYGIISLMFYIYFQHFSKFIYLFQGLLR